MKRLLQLVSMACIGVSALAIPAKPGFVTFTQPDGTEVEIQIVGDEHGHISYTSDGLVVLNVGDHLEYARFDEDGMAKPSGKMVTKGRLSKADAESFQTSRQIEKWAATMKTVRENRIAVMDLNNRMRKTVAEETTAEETDGRIVPLNFGRCASTFPVLGDQKGLVVLVEYQDIKFEYGDHDYFYRMLNEEGFSDHGSRGSVRDWFIENSDGQFRPEFDVFGPVTLPNNRSYYGGNDAYGNDKNPEQMAIHALDILDPDVDFTQYDRDEDGKIDNVFIFFAGKGEHDSNVSNAVWPHSWDVSQADADTTYVYDGVILDHYACTCEYPSGYKRPDGIGTFIHEFSHVMGLPDLYVTTYSGGFTPGPWSVLDYGPYNNDRLTPPNYSSFEKVALGWMEMLPMEEGVLELPELTESGKAYVLPTERETEFYFFENRQQVGNDAYLPYHGMLVWRVDYNEAAWDANTVNNTSSHQRVDLIEADNKKSESTRDGDPFPGVSNVTEFTYDTRPKLQSWKNQPLAYDIWNIEETEDGLIRFEVVPQGKEKPVDPSIPDDPGSVDSVTTDDSGIDVYYDLMGRRVKNPKNGIYIKNGKKVVID